VKLYLTKFINRLNYLTTIIEDRYGRSNDAKIFTDPDYVINNLLTEAGVLQQTEPVNPVTEIMTASRVVKSGKGGKIMPHCIVIYRKNNLVNSGKLRPSNVEDNPELSFQKLLTSD